MYLLLPVLSLDGSVVQYEEYMSAKIPLNVNILVNR